MTGMERRQLLAALGGTAGLAGCISGGDGDGPQWASDEGDTATTESAATETSATTATAEQVELMKAELDKAGIEGPDFETRVQNISRVIESIEGERDMWKQQAKTVSDEVSGDVTGVLNDLYSRAHTQYQSGQQAVDAVIEEYESDQTLYFAASEHAATAAGSFGAAHALTERTRQAVETRRPIEGSAGKLVESKSKAIFWLKWAVAYAQHCSIGRGLTGPGADTPQNIESIESDIDAVRWHPPDAVSFSYNPL